MGYTASDAIERIKLKAWTSTSSSLTDAQLIELLDDSLRSYIVPFLKSVRDEWFVSGSESVTPDSNGRIALPNSVASTIRTIWWLNNNQYVPLPRIEPENAPAYLGVNSGTQPRGFMLKGYEIQILPTNVGSITVRIDFMERPASMVLEEDAGEIESAQQSGATTDVTLVAMPIAWQELQPNVVDVVSSESPFSTLQEDVNVSGLTGNVISIDDLTTEARVAVLGGNAWLADAGSSPFPNIPIEFHPLLQQDVISTLYAGLGDKRLSATVDKQKKLEMDLRKTMAPRTQGSARPIINRSGPGMNSNRWR